MKRRGERLDKHYQQAFEYWLELIPVRPEYVVLCNFDEFWIYNFDIQLREPVDKVHIDELSNRYTALNFLFPDERKPLFNNNQIDVTRKAANNVAEVFNRIVAKGEDYEIAQRFILQCVVALFAEDIDLLPQGIFTQIIEDCRSGEKNSYDQIGALFRQMGSKRLAPKQSIFNGVQYFNGGIFEKVEQIHLDNKELDLLAEAASERWSKVEPGIFGSLFEASMGKNERHALGAHFTSEADIQKVILPTIVRPWKERIEKAKTLRDLLKLRNELIEFKVLDPACGSGNFLYVAYRELKRIELILLEKIKNSFTGKDAKSIGTLSLVKTKQFYGIDINPFAVELAKVTLMIAKKLALDEEKNRFTQNQMNLPIEVDKALPLDNLDKNIICQDALFNRWPDSNVVIGNPPYQSKNKMKVEFGDNYVEKLRTAFPEMPGRADFCVYWFRKAHDHLSKGERAGLVGTNTIRQNYSRVGGLEYIVKNGGTIIDSISSQVWSGDAVVHVSIANWIKGDQEGLKKLYLQEGDSTHSPWQMAELSHIGPALSLKIDVTQAKILNTNVNSMKCYQGQTHGNKGFILTPEKARAIITESPISIEVIHPYLIAGRPQTPTDLLGHPQSEPSRYVIDFNDFEDVVSLLKYKACFDHISEHVLPAVKKKALDEYEKTGTEKGPRQNHLKKWWKFWRGRGEMIEKISKINRYIACGRVTKRPIFEFIDSNIRPNDSLQVFAIDDDYSFGILQSHLHWIWFQERCSTLKRDPRYTSETVFNFFPFPQELSKNAVLNVANAAQNLRLTRREMMLKHNISLRDLYRITEGPGTSKVVEAQQELDLAVEKVYGVRKRSDQLQH